MNKEQVYELQELGIKVEYGEHSDRFISGSSFVVTSPGIPPKSDIFKKIQEWNIPIISEVEFAYRNTTTPFVAITGTNGKTTTTALTGKIMQEYFPSSYIVGNIGNPYTNAALQMKEDTLQINLSRFKC